MAAGARAGAGATGTAAGGAGATTGGAGATTGGAGVSASSCASTSSSSSCFFFFFLCFDDVLHRLFRLLLLGLLLGRRDRITRVHGPGEPRVVRLEVRRVRLGEAGGVRAAVPDVLAVLEDPEAL